MGDMNLSRRNLIQAMAGTSLMTGLTTLSAGEPVEAADEPAPANAEEALVRLKEGNTRFASGNVRHAHEAANWRKQLTQTQRPFATILGCSDSRVPIELVFDQGFGDIFVIRVAGNVVATDIEGSMQYALYHLKTPLVVVLGHQGCGAVTATLAAMDGKAEEPRFVNDLAEMIMPGLKGIDPLLKGAARLEAAVEANVQWALRQLREVPEGRPTLKEGSVKLVGAVYDLETGKVRFME